MEISPQTGHCHSTSSSQQNVALRGHRESINNDPNPGNFLALLKYLAKFHPVTRSHLDSLPHNSGCISQLLPTIQYEIIN